MKAPCVLVGLLLVALSTPREFTPPGIEARRDALGSIENLPPILKAALEPGKHFEPMGIPGENDWLAQHEEAGQTFDQFVRSRANRPRPSRKTIYLQPLGEFRSPAPDLAVLERYAEVFFQLPVEVLPPVELDDLSLTTRRHPSTGRTQLLTGDILSHLREHLPDDAFCTLGITLSDLYPQESWNFVFGQASLRGRVGVYSFARYDPTFSGAERGPYDADILLRRSLKVLVHETAHMFNVKHCIYYRCVMNGSNHLREADSRPLHLCPVCLRKMQHSIGLDVEKRYGELEAFYTKQEFRDDAKWMSLRLRRIRRVKGS